MEEQNSSLSAPRENSRSARTVPVHVEPGLVLTGWAIKSDVVLVRASGLEGRAVVEIDGARITPEAYHETTEQRLDAWEPLTALELPEGSFELQGEAYPPGLEPVHDKQLPVWRSLWCIIFPGMRGC